MNRPDLCLEFVNTRYWRGQAAPTETLNAPDDLAAWIAANGAPKGAKSPTSREFERAIELRETIHRLFDATTEPWSHISSRIGKVPRTGETPCAALNGFSTSYRRTPTCRSTNWTVCRQI